MSTQLSYGNPFLRSRGPSRGMPLRYFALLILAAAFTITAAAQSTGTGTLRGQVSDPSGAVVPNATIAILQSGGPTHSAKTNNNGNYEIGNLPPGNYTVTANADGFNAFIQNDVQLNAGQVLQFNIPLEIQVEQQKVNVEEEGPQVQVNPQNNASAVILSGKDLEPPPDDPDELQADLEALAGPSAGPNGGQLYIDGFTAGQLPPKSSIREIRINQNPFSAEYDKLGYGRIEIFTKPGPDQCHGQFTLIGNDSAFNSRSPYLGTANLPGYDTVQFNGDFGGPLSKKASFTVDGQYRDINNVAVVSAQLMAPPAPLFTAAVTNPRTRINFAPRLDYQVSTNNTLTVRYQYYRDNESNQGVGQYTLASAGYGILTTENTLQLSDTQVFGSKIVNETRFQYLDDASYQTPNSIAPAVIVPFEFQSGGSSLGNIIDHQKHYELQNYTSIAFGKHFLKFGGRLRDLRETNRATSNFNGTFIFPSLAPFEAS